ncbi:hypothetical protein Purlil1_8536 [Purpureocillium lilacinum]|uniref:DUF7924 domain-containing protein n=1 Tax=Purpureocillium lilacinum TaxID=33203 RepID=A0ABR0BSP2_PURLI|nr:hypothetical protein Purlil1_8536 [Purpureocillium lilacinum]
MAQINPTPSRTSPMASECKRKRPANNSTQASPPAKRCRFTGERRPANFPPLFWDNLSNVSLTTRALRELDRRNEAQQHSPISSGSGEVVPRDKARFARHGGPDLCHLRGFPAPMSTRSSKTSRRTESTEATSVSGRSSKSSAYNKNFQEHLIDHGVYLADQTDAEPRNLDSLHDQLLVPRTSLSPSTFSQSKFRDFQKKNNQVAFESDVMRTILPVLCGDHDDIPSQQNVLFTELEPITNSTAVKPKPDFFDGASLQDLHQNLRGDRQLRSTIIPTKHPGVPVAPNFFCEAKGPDGSSAVAQRQACYDGAYGVRAIHTLQNYGEIEPRYDGNAYTFSSTYHDGLLKLYTHHVTAPASAEGRPEYHMTQLDTWGMTGNIDSFRRGATAFRNAREMAERYRGAFIQAANTRAAPATTVDNAGVTAAHEETSASAQLEALEPADPSERGAWQDADNVLQQLIADGEGLGTSGP